MSELVYRERPAAGEPTSLLVLHHGRGADEHDLLGLADVLDPERRLHVVSPRAPLTVPGWPGHHWYLVPRVGYPDPDTFQGAFEKLAELHDELWARTGLGPERTVLGGFSMGAVMSYGLGLGVNRPAPAGILAFSGFIPTVPGWETSLADRVDLRVFIAHGRQDPVIGIEFARRARDRLTDGGMLVDYHEADGGHQIDPRHLAVATSWLAKTLDPDRPAIR
ncbi:MAG TPA: phospholipase [Solirubrobacteraceae bacterium]